MIDREEYFYSLCGSINGLSNEKAKKRKCLKCGVPITSYNYGLRFCGNCRAYNKRQGKIYAVLNKEA